MDKTEYKKIIIEQVMKILYERKVSPTLRTLIDSAEDALGRSHKIDRKVVFSNITASPGVKSLMVNADVYGSSQYKTSIIFYDVEYSKEESEKFNTPVQISDVGTMYFEKPNIDTSQTRVNCTCKWFQFACEWYLKPDNGLTPGRKPRPYSRKDGKSHGSPWSPNPKQNSCVCKHVYQVALEMKNRGMLS